MQGESVFSISILIAALMVGWVILAVLVRRSVRRMVQKHVSHSSNVGHLTDAEQLIADDDPYISGISHQSQNITKAG